MVLTKLDAPDMFCLYRFEHQTDTADFLWKLDYALYKERKSVHIDLTKIKFASAAASLLLFAIVSRAQLINEESGRLQTIRVSFPKKDKNPEGHRYIVATGLSKALTAGSIDKLDSLIDDKNYFQSSTNAHEHSVKTSLFLAKNGGLNDEQFVLLTSGISEAMLNVLHHAYSSPAYNFDVMNLHGKRWWQCAWFNPDADKVVFILCDLGMGVARSYTKSLSSNSFGDERDETQIIREAMTQGYSCTGINNGRGNGSEDIKRPIGAGCALRESLLILTGRTQYQYTSEKEEPTCTKIDIRVPGTLVEWSLIPTRGQNDD